MRRFSSFILSTVSLTALTATPAFGQATAGSPADETPEVTVQSELAVPPTSAPTNAEGTPVQEGDIVVTGSRLRRDNYNTPSPVAVITREDSVLAGVTSTAETLQSASITSGTSQISGSFLGFVSEGGAAANTVGLRGIGSQRTLTLLNGRRLAPAGVGNQLVAADLNVLPSAVVQRIEVLREGASSIYGSDAIAGVINVITDTRVNGVTFDLFGDFPLDVENSNTAGRTYRASVTAGKTFDRGHIMASFEYRQRNGIRIGDQTETDCPRSYWFNQQGQEVGQIDPSTGQLRCFDFSGGAGSGIASGYGVYAILLDQGDFGVPAPGLYAFGRVTYPGYVQGNPTIGGPVPVNPINLRPSPHPLQLESHYSSPIKTYTGYVNGAYELGALGNAELYGEALFTRRKSSQEGAVQINFDLNSLDTDTVQIYGGSTAYVGPGYNPNRPPLTSLPGFEGQQSPFYPTAWASWPVNRFTPFILPNYLQNETQRVDFFRGNAGLRGDLGLGDWRYDANVQISRTRSRGMVENPTTTKMNQTLVAVAAPAGTPSDLIVTALPGQAGAGVGYTCASNVTNGTYNGGDCIPLNFYDPNILIGGNLPANLWEWLYQENVNRTKYNQETLSLIFDGTLMELPAGGVQAAIGFEHRRDEIRDVPSEAALAGDLYNRASAGITAGKDRVNEVFGEVNVPILRDRPFFNLLEASASGRYTDYRSYGSDFTYRLNAQWAPVEALRFRASYGTNFRAPNLYEQFVANQTGFYPGAADPCNGFGQLSPQNIVYQNCLAALTPILGANALGFIANSGPEVTTRGGADILESETAKSWGLGAVVTLPRDIVDFSLAIDYFNILVKDEVTTLGNVLMNLCYGATDFPNNVYCQFVGPRELPGEGAFPGTITTLDNPFLNVAQQTAKGIDINARYATPLFGGRFQTQLFATRMLEQGFELFEGNGLFDFNGTLGYPGFGSGPKWTGTLDTRFSKGPLTFRWGVEYVGRASSNIPDLVSPQFFAGQLIDVDLTAEPYYEHGLSVQYRWAGVGQITVGVNNVFNEKPPIISDSIDTGGQYFRIGNWFGGGPYDYVGRSVFVNLTKSF